MIAELCRFPSYVTAYPTLDRFQNDFLDIVHHGWTRYMGLPPADRVEIHEFDVFRAGVVSAFMSGEANRRFDNRREEGIIPRDRYKPRMWSFNNRVLVRLKKLDENGLSKNLQTDRAKKINLGLPIEDEELTEAVRVDVGYQLNDLKTEIDQVLISHRNGNRLIWKYAIKEDGNTLVLPLYGDDQGPDLGGGSFVRPRNPDVGTGGRRDGTHEADGD